MFNSNCFNVSALENLMLSLTPACCNNLTHYVMNGLDIDTIVALLEDDMNHEPAETWVGPNFRDSDSWEEYADFGDEFDFHDEEADQLLKCSTDPSDEVERHINWAWCTEDQLELAAETAGEDARLNAHVHDYYRHTLSAHGYLVH